MADLEDKNKKEINELGLFFQLIPDMLCIASAEDGYFKELNPAWEQTLGFTREELLSKPLVEFIHPDDRASTMLEIEKQLKGQPTIHFNNRYICKDGSYKWLSWTSTQAKGNLLYATARDITKYKKSEEALIKEKEKLQKYLDISAVMVIMLDVDQRVTLINKKGCEILGCVKEETIGKNWFNNFIPVNKRGDVKVVFDKLMAGEIEPVDYYENEVLTKNGEERLIAWYNIVFRDEDGNIANILSTGTDITERKMAEDWITSFGMILEESLNEIYIFDSNTLQFIQVNKGARENLGYSMEELVNLTPLDIKPEFTPDYFSKLVEPLRTGKKEQVKFTTVHRRKDSTLYPVEVNIQYSTYKSSPAFIAIILDITDRKAAEEAMQLERDNLTLILESMEDGVYIVNQQNDIQYLNPVLLKEFGPYKKEKCYEYFHDVKEVCPWCKNKDVFAGKTVHWEWSSPKTGKTFDLIDTPIKNSDGSISKLEIFRDITERKKTEEELAKHHEHLEERVMERTLELEERTSDLEKYNKLFTDREFRIKELRDKVKELEGKRGS